MRGGFGKRPDFFRIFFRLPSLREAHFINGRFIKLYCEFFLKNVKKCKKVRQDKIRQQNAQFSLVSEGVPLGVLIMTAAMVPHPEITNILKVRKYILKIKEIQEALFEQI